MDRLPPEILARIFSESPALPLVASHVSRAFRDGVLWSNQRQSSWEIVENWIDAREYHLLKWAFGRGYRPRYCDKIVESGDLRILDLFSFHCTTEDKRSPALCYYAMATGQLALYKRAREKGWTCDADLAVGYYVSGLVKKVEAAAGTAERLGLAIAIFSYLATDPEARAMVRRNERFRQVAESKALELLEDPAFDLCGRVALRQFLRSSKKPVA